MLLLWNSFLGIEEGIVSLLLLIDSTLYSAFSKLFSIYVELASARIFDINDFDDLIHNIYLLIGVVALFLISYLLLKNMVSADEKASSKEILDIIKRFIVAMVLVPLVPVFFDFLYDFQNSLLSNQTITKLMLGNGDVSTTGNVVELQDENGNPIYGDDCNATSLEEAKQNCTPLTSTIDMNSNELLKDYGNQAAYYVLSGFISPEDGWNAEDIETNASEYFNLGHNIKWAGIACAIGGGIATATVVVLEVVTSPATGFATLAGVPATIASFGGAILGACGIAAGSSLLIDGVGYLIDYEHYTWKMAELEMITTGDFSRITSFAENITGGELHYTPIISTIGAIFLLYMMFSFCLDLGVRAVKLIFFQLMAPICFLISVIPKKKDLLNNWFKLVLTTWLEVFVRIFCVCGVVLFISMLDYDSLKNNFSTFATAILILGIVTFAKQLPKLFSQVTGIDSGNMKLGIKEKLAEGGAFTAGAIIGGGATAFARNAVNAGRNFMGNYEKDANGKWKRKKGVTNWDLIKSGISGVGSIAAGTASAQFRGGKAGLNAKSFGDMKNAAGKGAKDAVNARDKRANYKAAHGGNVVGAMMGHMKDFGGSVKNFVLDESIEGLTRESQSMGKVVSKYNTFNDTIENLLEKEQAKGNGSLFLGNGFALTNYSAFNDAANGQKAARAAFNGNYQVNYDYIDRNGIRQRGFGNITTDMLTDIESYYVQNRDAVRDELMNMSLEGTKGRAYQALTAKGQAALKDSLVNAESLQATILENASSKVVQNIMGANGNNALNDIINGNSLNVGSFTHRGSKLKDAAKVAQGQAEIKIAEMNKEQAAKGDKSN